MDISKEDLERIKKECFWDYDISLDEIKRIIKEGSFREKNKLFEKIMYNSKDKAKMLSYFNKDDLQKLFSLFKVTYNKKNIEKHKQVLEYIFFGKKSKVKGLEWRRK